MLSLTLVMHRAAADDEDSPGAAPAASLPPVIGSKRPAILADGTYATQAAVVEVPLVSNAPTVPNLRALLLGGDFFLGGVLAGTLTKLILRLKQHGALTSSSANRLSAEAMLYIVSIVRLGDSPLVPTPLDDDSRDRMTVCLAILANPDEEAVQVGTLLCACYCCMQMQLCPRVVWCSSCGQL